MDKIITNEENISSMIFTLRGEKVMLDSDLSEIYGVETKRLNEQVKRNISRFPSDFMFQLNDDEWKTLRSQNATSSWGGRRTLPYAFTEHGAIMLASVLNSETAIKASIAVVRAFVKLREFVLMSKEIAKKLEDFEKSTNSRLDTHDKKFHVVFETLKKVLIQEEQPKKKIGFITEEA